MDQTKIYDIAGTAGVSLATVSRVLNHPEKVKKATRDKVLRIIKDKGYKPNANARGLASRHSTTVAVVLPTLTRASIAETIQGIHDSAKKFGYTLRLFVNNEKEDEKELWSEVIASSVDGILFMNDEMSREVYQLIENTPVPVVFVNALSKNKNIGSVSIDNEECSYELTKHLISKGNKDILFLTTESYYAINEQMLHGYKRAMQEAGLSYNVVQSSGKIYINELQFETLLKENPKPDVVLGVRDSMTISFMNVAQKLGYKVPDDIQFMGFQNTRYSELSYPKLSCVSRPIYEIGNVAMSKLTELMKEENKTGPSKTFLNYSIVWRDSTKNN